MSESQLAAMDRLRREGRWTVASIFRDEARRRLRDEGKPRQEANQAAWAAMIAEYPPLDESEVAEVKRDAPPVCQPSSVPDDPLPDIETDVLGRLKSSSPNLCRDILWVYDRLEDKTTKPEDAPGLGAWSMLNWAREYRNRFFEQLLPKALKSADAIAESEDIRVVDPSLEEVMRMLKQINEME